MLDPPKADQDRPGFQSTIAATAYPVPCEKASRHRGANDHTTGCIYQRSLQISVDMASGAGWTGDLLRAEGRWQEPRLGRPWNVSSRDDITWSGSAAGSAPFNSEAVAVGIRGTAGAVGIPGAVGILDRVRRERRAVAAVGVTGRIRIIRVRAQLAAIVPLLVIQPRRIRPAVVPMYEYKTRPHCLVTIQPCRSISIRCSNQRWSHRSRCQNENGIRRQRNS